MKLLDIITVIDFEKVDFSEISSRFAKVKKSAESMTVETKEFFKDYITDDFWRVEHEKEASV